MQGEPGQRYKKPRDRCEENQDIGVRRAETFVGEEPRHQHKENRDISTRRTKTRETMQDKEGETHIIS